MIRRPRRFEVLRSGKRHAVQKNEAAGENEKKRNRHLVVQQPPARVKQSVQVQPLPANL